ncbi:hypothetical protein [Oribacterium sp. WCC10]|uniref:hypothetical protein n=1 Tax=Oribacterium sp. WCC10 TaxID=1855343 RepID=UPI0008E925EA|nr:hypothetical protein [Oribacterium sp. WCC10]SFG34203.1 hypothetical protein SAMN05216356_10651 [Oribacterium sp. WCC10]
MTIKKITKDKVQMVLPALFALILIGFFVNRNIQIRGLYGDDLYLWSFYGEDNFWEFTFPLKTKGNFRPFYWALSYLEFMIVGRHVNYYSTFNVFVNIFISFVIYFFSMDLTKAFEKNGRGAIQASLISFLTAGMYLGSHFAAYQIGQVLGLLESMALLLAIIVLWMLYRFIERRNSFWYFAGCITYFLVIFTHERYIALFPLFYLVLIGRRLIVGRFDSSMRYMTKAFVPILELVFFFGVRMFIAGQAMPAGTAGTDVSDTFDLIQALGYSIQQVQYIFGVNVGEAYLDGINWLDTPLWLKLSVYFSWVILILMIAVFIRESFRKAIDPEWVSLNLLFITFIAMCIGCSSITVRLEIRWVYVSYTAALLYLCFMYGRSSGRCEERISGKSRKKSREFKAKEVFAIMFIAYCIVMTPVEQLYRSNFNNIFFMTDISRVNSLADETIGKYQNFLGVRQTYIFYNRYGMTDFYGEYFYKPFDPEKTGQGSEVHFINDISELPKEASYDNSVVLLESTDTKRYLDITDQVFGKADWDAIKQMEQ